MMTSINTNVGALNARASAVRATSKMEQAMERLSSGLRVNSAADDAAGLSVAGKMESQLRGINMSIRNAQDGVGLIQTAGGLVSKEQFGLSHQRTSDRRTLPFSARQLTGAMMGTISKPHTLDQFIASLNPLVCRLSMRNYRKQNIFEH